MKKTLITIFFLTGFANISASDAPEKKSLDQNKASSQTASPHWNECRTCVKCVCKNACWLFCISNHAAEMGRRGEPTCMEQYDKNLGDQYCSCCDEFFEDGSKNKPVSSGPKPGYVQKKPLQEKTV
jgi:hypothetical protein